MDMSGVGVYQKKEEKKCVEEDVKDEEEKRRVHVSLSAWNIKLARVWRQNRPG